MIAECASKTSGEPTPSFLRSVAGVCLLFVFVYAPTHLSTAISFAAIPVAIGFVALLVNWKAALRMLLLPQSIYIVILLSLSTVCGIISTLVMVGEDVYFPLLMAKAILVYLPVSVGLILLLCDDRIRNCFDAVTKLLFFAMLIQALAILLQFAVPAFNLWTSEFILERGNIGSLHEFRFRGISDAGGSAVSLMQGFGVFLGAYYALIEKRWAARMGYLFGLWALLISATLVGRTGVLVGVLGLLTALACVFSSRKLILSHLTATVGIGMLIAAVLLFLFQEKVEVYRDIVVQYAFEPIVNYIQEGTFTASSTEDLLTMLYLPDRIQHFLLGVGAFDAPGHGLLQTDSGYLKTLLSSGLLGVLFTYGSFLLLFCVVVLSAHKSARFIFVIAFAGLFITEVKEPFLYQNAVSRGLWILFAAALYDHLKRGNIEKPAMCTLVNPGMSGVQK